MKKLILVITIICLLFGLSLQTFGAALVKSSGDPFAATDSWYTVDPKEPFFYAYFQNIDAATPVQTAGVHFFKNDHTFIDLDYDDSAVTLCGSYLSKPGFFIGVDYDSSISEVLTISPGFRLNLNDRGYLGFGLDYLTNGADGDILDYEVIAKIFANRMKFTAGFVSYPILNETVTSVGLNYKIIKPLVLGGKIEITDGSLATSTSYSTGYTLTLKPLILDGEIGNTGTYDYCAFSGVFKLNKLCLGAEYYKQNNYSDGKTTFKAKFGSDDTKLVLKFTPENDTYYSSMSFAYEFKF